jgi:hypothetical protein
MDVYYKYDLYQKSVSFLKGEWYAVVINLNQVAKQLSLFLIQYTRSNWSY